jgi:hypothetical protein
VNLKIWPVADIGAEATEIFCDELGLPRSELCVLAENRVI